MSKMIIEKNATHRKYVSPSADTDRSAVQQKSIPVSGKAAAGLATVIGLWAIRRFPKTVLLGAVAVGIFAGLNRKDGKNKNPFQGEGIVKDLLH